MEQLRKILVVVDAKENVALLAGFLANMGHTPVVAHSGTQAVQLFESESPNLVLMDVTMPAMDGVEAAKRMKALCGPRRVPVVFLTALAQSSNPVKVLPDAALLANEVEIASPPRLDEIPDFWRLGLSFGAAELRHLDVVPLLMNIVEQVKDLQTHASTVFLILSELYNNALDHGLLELDSGMKGLPDGFEQYLELREERLAALTEGHIEVNFERTALDGRPMLKIQVRDSGRGFHHDNLLHTQMEGNADLHGRGIALVRTVCAKLHYLGNGNEVVAYCRL